VQHADDGYSRRGNFARSLSRNTFLIYSPDDTNIYGSRTMEFGGSWAVQGIEMCEIMFLGGTSYSLVQTLLALAVRRIV